jgi:hypothetical protein
MGTVVPGRVVGGTVLVGELFDGDDAGVAVAGGTAVGRVWTLRNVLHADARRITAITARTAAPTRRCVIILCRG